MVVIAEVQVGLVDVMMIFALVASTSDEHGRMVIASHGCLVGSTPTEIIAINTPEGPLGS